MISSFSIQSSNFFVLLPSAPAIMRKTVTLIVLIFLSSTWYFSTFSFSFSLTLLSPGTAMSIMIQYLFYLQQLCQVSLPRLNGHTHTEFSQPIALLPHNFQLHLQGPADICFLPFLDCISQITSNLPVLQHCGVSVFILCVPIWCTLTMRCTLFTVLLAHPTKW